MDSIQAFCGNINLTVSETMQKIDKNANGILFIVNDAGIILGCITDGDIRRYLLSGGKMTGQVMEAANKNPRIAKSEEEAKRLYHKKNFTVIPIVDEAGAQFPEDPAHGQRPSHPHHLPPVA